MPQEQSVTIHLISDVPVNTTEDNHSRSLEVIRKLKSMACIAAIGGFLSGYNTGVISGAMLPLRRVFGLSRRQEEILVSSTILAAFFSSLLGGVINTRLGRRKTIMLAAFIFNIGAIIIFYAQHYIALIIGELALGFGIGIESLTSPMYICEVSKPSMRGMLVTMYSTLMVIGQFTAGVVDGVFGSMEDGWRYMFGVAAVPGLVMLVGFVHLPESPGWLIANNKFEEAQDVLETIRDTDQEVNDDMDDMKNSMLNMNGDDADPLWKRFKDMMDHQPTRRAITVGCGLMLLQQFCGINTVLYYASTIYEMSGFNEITSIWLSCCTSVAQIVAQLITVCYVEKTGRRLLVLISIVSVAISAIGLAISFYLARVMSYQFPSGDTSIMDEQCASQPARLWNGRTSYCYDCVQIEGCGFCGGMCVKGDHYSPFDTNVCPSSSEWSYETCSNPYAWISVFFMVLYVFVFGIGMGGLPWTINAEIYPLQHRSFAVSLSTATNWIANWVLSSIFLTISSPTNLTLYGSFIMYSFVSFLGGTWLFYSLPETKGLSLEKIAECFSNFRQMKKLIMIKDLNGPDDIKSYGAISV